MIPDVTAGTTAAGVPVRIRGGVLPNPEYAVAIVGGRNVSPAACKVAAAIARKRVRDGFTVATTGAYGIEEAALWAAAEDHGPWPVHLRPQALAVLMYGLAAPTFPSSMRETLEELVAGGRTALVSPFDPDVPATRENSFHRDEVLIGMVGRLVIVDARVRSTAAHLADLATAAGVPITVFPGSPLTDLLLETRRAELIR